MADDEKQQAVEARVRALVRELEGLVDHAGDVLLDEIARLKAEIAREKAWRDG